jgi:hypothetical protein
MAPCGLRSPMVCGGCPGRIYLGLHYPSDLLGGGLIGLLCGYLTPRMGGNRIATQVLTYEARHTQAFYALAFLATFEIASIFDDVRVFGHGLLRLLQAIGFRSLHLMGALVVSGTALLLFVLAIGALVRWRPPSQT